MSEKISLGEKVKDGITGFTGIVTSRTEYLHDNPSLGIQPLELKEGKPGETVWLAETRVSRI